MMRRSGRAAFSPAITSNRFCPARVPSRTRSISLRGPNSARLQETSSRSVSVSNSDFNPINRSGSLSTTAMRIVLFDAPAFIKTPSKTRGVNDCIVSKKSSARPESIMNLSPSPLLSRVHVLKLKRKVGEYYSGLLAGFQPATVWTQQKAIGVAEREATPVAIAITFLGGQVALAGGMKVGT